MAPEVTAVITTHARPASVCEALASIRAELHEDLEVVVVDDGGAFVAPDDCDVPIRVVHGSGLGVARARNLGLDAARGEFIIYLDDDDVALPNRIASLLRAARQRRASLCFGMTRRVVGNAKLQDVPTQIQSSGILSSGAVGFCDVLTCNPHVNAVLVKTETLRAAGGFDSEADHFDDWAAWLRIIDGGAAIWRIDETVAEWRIHAQGLSGNLLHIRGMKSRLLALFRRLQDDLSPENARAVATAQQVVRAADIVTYDDYVHAMTAARELQSVSEPGRRPSLPFPPGAD